MTNTIESIDLQIKELQEQKRKLIEKQKAEEETRTFNIVSIVDAANQRLHEILLHHGAEEADQLSINCNKNALALDASSLLSISLVNSSDQFLFFKVVSVANVHLFVDRILTNAVALAEINRKFGSMMKLDNSSRDSIRLITSKDVEVRLLLSDEDNKFDISVQDDLSVSADKLIVGSKESRASVEVDGVCLSARFIYKKDRVEVNEIAEVLEEIDSEFDKIVIDQY